MLTHNAISAFEQLTIRLNRAMCNKLTQIPARAEMKNLYLNNKRSESMHILSPKSNLLVLLKAGFTGSIFAVYTFEA